MSRSLLRYSVVALLGLFACQAANAAYDKAFRFKLPADLQGNAPNVKIRAVTDALEIVESQYDGWRNPWSVAVPAYVVSGGAYTTRLNYNTVREPQINPATGRPFAWDNTIKVGWSTTDSSCRLKDLRWRTGAGDSVNVLKDESAIPGGGEIIQIAGTYYWHLTHDQPVPLPIPLNRVEVLEFEEPLTPQELGQITELSGFRDQTAAIAAAIAALQAEIAASDFNNGWKNSLTQKLDKALDDKATGDAAYEPPAMDLATAQPWWASSAQHVQTFVNQMQNSGKGKNAPNPPTEWTDQGLAIIDALSKLPLWEGTLGDSETGYDRAANGNEIPPGGTEIIPLGALLPGDVVVVHGDVVDESGAVVLEWAEQAIIPLEMIPPTVTIQETDDPAEPGSVWVDITATDESELSDLYLTIQPVGNDVAMAPGDVELQFEHVPAPPGAAVVAIKRLVNEQAIIHAFSKDKRGNVSPPGWQIITPGYILVVDGTGATLNVDGVPHELPYEGIHAPDTTVALEIDPHETYVFNQWTGDAEGDDPQLTVAMDGDRAITPVFTRVPPAVVYVDDDYDETATNDGHEWGYDAFAVIQDGVDAVTEAGTVNVAGGTYAENLTLI